MSGEDQTSESTLAELPAWLALPYRHCFLGITDEGRFQRLAAAGLNAVQQKPELMKVLSAVGHPKVDIDEQSMKEAEDDAGWVEAEAQRDHPILHARSSVALWSHLEVFSEDLAVAWLLNREDAWNAETIQDLKISVATFERLDRDERARHVISEVQKKEKSELKGGLAPITLVLEKLNIAPELGDNVRKALHELRQVRNAIMHRGGRADRRLREGCTDVPWAIGQRIMISEDLFWWYYQAALHFPGDAVSKAGVALGVFDLNDVGPAHDIDRRPTG